MLDSQAGDENVRLEPKFRIPLSREVRNENMPPSILPGQGRGGGGVQRTQDPSVT